MKFTLTGTASGMPVVHRRHSSLVIEDGTQKTLIDAGEGTAAALLAAGIALNSISRIIITHTHADHVSGLPMLLQGMYLAGRETPMQISVPPGRVQWFRDWLHGMYVFKEKWSFDFQVQQYGDMASMDEGLRIAPFANRHLEAVRELASRHDVPSMAYSLHVSTRCCSAVISSDIAALADVAAAAEGSDLLIIDSAHASQDDIYSFAAAHEQLVIICTHIPPELEPGLMALRERSTAEVDGRVLYAYDGMEYLLEKTAV